MSATKDFRKRGGMDKIRQKESELVNLLQVLKILLLVFIVGSASIEIFELRKILLFSQNLFQCRRIFSGAKPASRCIAFSIIQHPLLRLFRHTHNLVNPNFPVLACEYRSESVGISGDAWRIPMAVQFVEQTVTELFAGYYPTVSTTLLSQNSDKNEKMG